MRKCLRSAFSYRFWRCALCIVMFPLNILLSVVYFTNYFDWCLIQCFIAHFNAIQPRINWHFNKHNIMPIPSIFTHIKNTQIHCALCTLHRLLWYVSKSTFRFVLFCQLEVKKFSSTISMYYFRIHTFSG